MFENIVQLKNLYMELIPLVIFMIFGFIVARLKVDSKSIGNILTYILIPSIYLRTGWSTAYELQYLMLPFAFFLLSCALCLVYLFLGGMVWKDKTKNLLAFSAGSGNVVYFMLAIVMGLFPQDILVLYLIGSLGTTIYQYTLGIWVVASGSYSIKQAFFKMLQVPVIHAFAIGIILNSFKVPMPEVASRFFSTVNQSSVVLGLMMIGISMPKISELKIDWHFLYILFSARFLVSPLIVLFLIFCDIKFWHLYTFYMHCIFLLLALAPPATNTIVFAALFDNKVAEAATAVLISIIFIGLSFPLILVGFKFFALP